MTLEGLQDEAAEFGAFIADQGAEQCGFCNPGFIMNALALFREKEYPTDEEIKEYLSGNLCRCSGYEGQLRGIQNFLAWKKAKKEAAEPEPCGSTVFKTAAIDHSANFPGTKVAPFFHSAKSLPRFIVRNGGPKIKIRR